LRLRRFVIALLLAAPSALIQAGSSMAGAGPTVDCGQLTAYTAPDPVGPSSGVLGLGVLTPWEIVATASVSVAAAAALPSMVNSGPTCVSLEFDSDGKITSVDFVGEGDITGAVGYDGASGFYLFADRLIVPSFITDEYPGLAALFVTSYQAQTSLTVTFFVDVTTGAFTGFDGHTEFCGKAGVTAGGFGKIGDARIPAAALDAGDVATLDEARGDDACAAVHLVGVILPNAEGAIDVATDVVITVEAAAGATVLPTLPNTSATETTKGRAPANIPALVFIALLAVGMLLATRPHSVSSRR